MLSRGFDAYYIQEGSGTLPNGGRNTLPIRPIDNLDLSLYKRVTVHERYSVEIGMQAWNALNHPQYQPGTVANVNGPTYTSSYNFQTVTNAFFNRPEKQFLNNARNVQLRQAHLRADSAPAEIASAASAFLAEFCAFGFGPEPGHDGHEQSDDHDRPRERHVQLTLVVGIGVHLLKDCVA